jgi:hypothetical protein
MLNHRGFVAGATGANIFFVIEVRIARGYSDRLAVIDIAAKNNVD